MCLSRKYMTNHIVWYLSISTWSCKKSNYQTLPSGPYCYFSSAMCSDLDWGWLQPCTLILVLLLLNWSQNFRSDISCSHLGAPHWCSKSGFSSRVEPLHISIQILISKTCNNISLSVVKHMIETFIIHCHTRVSICLRHVEHLCKSSCVNLIKDRTTL